MGFVGMGRPIIIETIIPTVMKSYVMTPRGPFNSIGAVSLMYRGTNTEKLPPAKPLINLPTKIAY